MLNLKDKNGRGLSTDSNFMNIVTNCYFVDKSLLIKDLIDNYSDMPTMLFTRPRRFGKSLNLSMIRTFFEKIPGEDTSSYFRHLEIWKCGEKYTSMQGKYPVIYMNLKSVSGDVWDDLYSDIKDKIQEEYKRHSELCNNVAADDLDKYNDIKRGTGTDSEYKDSLRFLCELLYKQSKEKPIILIDEYDTPIQKGIDNNYDDKVIDFIKSFFSNALKDNSDLSFAVLMGITRVSKEGIFSGLNNLSVYSILNDEFSQYFGFTEDEVKKILDDFGCQEKMDEVCEWYDGYRFGKNETRFFNPWSVVKYIQAKCVPDTYWANTSANSIIGDTLEIATEDVEDGLRGMLENEVISAPVDENITYKDLKDDSGNVYSLLLMSGYLKCVSFKDGVCELTIPNKEIRKIYNTEIIKKIWGERGLSSAKKISTAIEKKDPHGFKNALQQFVSLSCSYFDVKREVSYKDIMLGVLSSVDNEYTVTAEENLPDGRVDIALTPLERNKERLPAVIFEFEKCDNVGELDKKAQEGRNQIDDKKYDARLTAKGFKDIFKLGVAFCGGAVQVQTEYRTYASYHMEYPKDTSDGI